MMAVSFGSGSAHTMNMSGYRASSDLGKHFFPIPKGKVKSANIED
jgi:hypothetical protein